MHKLSYLIIIATIFYSCNSPKAKPQDEPGNGWILSDSMVAINKYTKNGFLDTSYHTYYTYYKGLLVATAKSFKVRSYDSSNNVTDERDFRQGSNNFRQTSEIISVYDKNNNPIHFIDKNEGKIVDENWSEYNIKGLCIKVISVASDIGIRETFKNIDSDYAHRNDWMANHDTTIWTFTYDTIGHLLNEIKSYPNNKLKTVKTYEYSGEYLLLQTSTRNNKKDIVTTSFFIYTDSLTKEINDFKDIGIRDTSWLQGANCIKEVSNNINIRKQHLTLFTYDSHGNLLKAVTYRRDTPVAAL